MPKDEQSVWGSGSVCEGGGWKAITWQLCGLVERTVDWVPENLGSTPASAIGLGDDFLCPGHFSSPCLCFPICNDVFLLEI